MRGRPLEIRFWEQVRRAWKANGESDVTKCWEWVGAKNHRRGGYGVISEGGDSPRRLAAHRVSYELHFGQIQKGLHIDHLCRNPGCVNPTHLEAVRPVENTLRGLLPTLTRARYETRLKCRNGHSLSGENLYVKKTSRGTSERHCRTCRNEEQRARRAGRRVGKPDGRSLRFQTTHCKNGHPWTEESTRVSANGSQRICRPCRSEWAAARRASTKHKTQKKDQVNE